MSVPSCPWFPSLSTPASAHTLCQGQDVLSVLKCNLARQQELGELGAPFLFSLLPLPPPFLLSFRLHSLSLPPFLAATQRFIEHLLCARSPARCWGYRDQDRCRLCFSEASTPGRQVTTHSSRPCRSKEGTCHPRGGDIGAVT